MPRRGFVAPFRRGSTIGTQVSRYHAQAQLSLHESTEKGGTVRAQPNKRMKLAWPVG